MKIIRLLTLFTFAFCFPAARGLSLLQALNQSNSIPGNHSFTIESAARTRTYFVHVPPSYDAKSPLPLVIVLHGGGGNATGAETMSGMSAKADKEHFLVAYPNGTGVLPNRLLTWNSGNCCTYAVNNHVDDISFIRSLIDALERDYSVDPKRIFVTGISNGGMMSYRLACELAGKIAAIAPVAGDLNIDCHPSAPVAVVAFHGTKDQNVPFDGGTGTKHFGPSRVDNSVAYAINFWTKQDACSPSPQHSESASLRTDIYSGCTNGTAVAPYTIIGQGHAWPGGNRMSTILDEPSHTVSATVLMWSFFAQHPKP